jgi:hypothetical protein
MSIGIHLMVKSQRKVVMKTDGFLSIENHFFHPAILQIHLNLGMF